MAVHLVGRFSPGWENPKYKHNALLQHHSPCVGPGPRTLSLLMLNKVGLHPKYSGKLFEERKCNFAWPFSYYAVTKL